MLPIEKRLKTALQLATTKERLYSYGDHTPGKVRPIQGLSALMFFALAEHQHIDAIADHLGSANSLLFHRTLTVTANGTRSMGSLEDLFRNIFLAVGESRYETVLKGVVEWVDLYTEALDAIPSIASLPTSLHPQAMASIHPPGVGIQSNATISDAVFLAALGGYVSLINQSEPDRFARYLERLLRPTAHLERYLVVGFGRNHQPVSGVREDTFQAWKAAMARIKASAQYYTKIVRLSTPPVPSRAAARYPARRGHR